MKETRDSKPEIPQARFAECTDVRGSSSGRPLGNEARRGTGRVALPASEDRIMIEVSIKCPSCGESLMDEDRQIDGHPSISVEGEAGGKRGKIWLSSLYGSYNVESDIEIPQGGITKFFCRKCGDYLVGTRVCELCDAPMVPFRFAEGGIVQICSRRGCKRHLIEFTDIRSELQAFYDRHGARL